MFCFVELMITMKDPISIFLVKWSMMWCHGVVATLTILIIILIWASW